MCRSPWTGSATGGPPRTIRLEQKVRRAVHHLVRPAHIDLARAGRQRAVLYRIRCEFVDGERHRQRLMRLHIDVGTLDRKSPFAGAVRLERILDRQAHRRLLPGRLAQDIVRLVHREDARRECGARLIVRRAAEGVVCNSQHGGERVLDPVLQFLGQKFLPLRRHVFDGDVLGDREKVGRVSVFAENRRDLNVPKARRAFRGVRCALEMSRLAADGRRHRSLRISVPDALPEIRPGTSLERGKIVDLHHALSAFAHELKAAVEIQNLDAVAAAGQHAAQQVIVLQRVRGAQLISEDGKLGRGQWNSLS